MTLTETTTNRKRKFTGTLEPARPSKLPRKTLDSFFTPLVPLSSHVDAKESQPVQLNDAQHQVLRMVAEEGKNVFFTGSAGTGKSLLLRAIIASLRKKHARAKAKPDSKAGSDVVQSAVVSVTASTGMAASNIGGMTIHSWGALTPGQTDIDKQVKCIRTCRPALKRWKETRVLIIDEVSMLDGYLFDTIEKVATKLRKKSDRPFGGIQLVVTGDFFQLPPVTKGKEPFFAFESEAWKRCMEHTVNLTQVFRQKDNRFVDVLNDLRRGTISPAAITIFESLTRPLAEDAGIIPTELFPLRAEVERANYTRLKALPSHTREFLSRDSGTAQPERRATVLSNMVAQDKVHLKVDAQVMLVKNVDEVLVNGSVGRVLGFFTAAEVVGAGAAGEVSKGGSGVIRDVRVEEDGRTPVKKMVEKENEKPKSEGKPKSMDGGCAEMFPLIEFRTPQGKEIVLVGRDEFRVEDNEGNVIARRVQVPLVLAWAMSIHKSQGQTLQYVKIDLGKVFEKGQSYVALSRAASLEGLQVLRFDPRKVMAHPKVVEWSKNLETRI